MAERARIARYFAPLTEGEPGSFSLTDDAAVLTPPPGQSLVVTTDSVIEGVHVLRDAIPQHFAAKLMRRNLSDLAAMGATPWRYSLNVHTPTGLWEDWFAGFAVALLEEQERFGLTLIGGDSTSAPDASIHVTMTCFGLIDGAPLRRTGAQRDDDLYVSGVVGDAALGLKLLQQHTPHEVVRAYHEPEPRLALGQALRGIASAALDVSDGLLDDAAQLGVGLVVDRAALPLSDAFRAFLQDNPGLWDLALNGGDDYELCFTAAPAHRARIDALAERLPLKLTRIGRVVAGTRVTLIDETGAARSLPRGYEHG